MKYVKMLRYYQINVVMFINLPGDSLSVSVPPVRSKSGKEGREEVAAISSQR